MATRSAIGFKKIDGTIEAVYCHWDGYPAHNGKILMNHYPVEKTQRLLAEGSLSSLRQEIGEYHPFDAKYNDEPELPLSENWCMFYGRDRGESGQGSHTYKDAQDYTENFHVGGVEFFYLQDSSGQWLVLDVYKEDNIWDFVETRVSQQEADHGVCVE